MAILSKKEAPGSEAIKEENKAKEQAELARVQEKIKREVEFHAMPERFRRAMVTTDSSKITGILIMVGGLVFLGVAGFLVYKFVFLPTKQPVVTPIVNQATTTDEEPEIIPATTTEPEIIATTTEPEVIATTTEPEIIATTTEPEVIATTTEPEIVASDVDADADGLTEKEELILGTSDQNKDSDSDSYPDLSEVLNFYDPASTGKLINNLKIARYDNEEYSYSVLTPTEWTRVEIGSDSIMFKAEDNSLFQIIVQPNTNKMNIQDWYKELMNLDEVASDQLVVADNWQGVKSQDGLIYYFTDSEFKYLYALSYTPAATNILSYKNIFELLIKSFTKQSF